MLGLLALVVTVFLAAFGYAKVRDFVRTRLRFVDKVQRPLAPIVAGGLAALITLPLTWLPLVTAALPVLLGVGVGFGVAHGARDIRRGTAGLLEP